MRSPKAELNPIVEFFPVSHEGSDLFLETSNPDQRALRKMLRRAKGIYAFYNSEAEVIYIGKTEKQNLWHRMKSSYTQEKARYDRYYVSHPRWKFDASYLKVRKIVRRKVTISDVAKFCSAYSLSPELIAFSEQLLIRLIPNDLINLRMEGNATLRTFASLEATTAKKMKKQSRH